MKGHPLFYFIYSPGVGLETWPDSDLTQLCVSLDERRGLAQQSNWFSSPSDLQHVTASMSTPVQLGTGVCPIEQALRSVADPIVVIQENVCRQGSFAVPNPQGKAIPPTKPHQCPIQSRETPPHIA